MFQTLDSTSSETTLKDSVEQTVIIREKSLKFNYGIIELENENPESIANKFFSRSKIDTDILPPVTRWVSKNMDHILVERPPFTVNISYSDIHFERGMIDGPRCDDCDPEYGCDCGYEADNAEYASYSFILNIPWTCWCFNLSEEQEIMRSYVYCRTSSISSVDDSLYYLPITNLYEDGQICWGNALMRKRKDYNSLSSYIMDAINSFWVGEFNNDLTALIGNSPYFDETFTDSALETWSKKTMEEVLSADYEMLDTTVGELFEHFNRISKQLNKTDNNKYQLSKFFMELANEN